MSANSAIEWTDHTFNPWHGCVKVSPGCQHCYAETLSKRWGRDIWGPAKTTSRLTFGDKHWAEPLKWNKQAEEAGKRARVFCASMADVFEDHSGVGSSRHRLWKLIGATPWLDWLLLTKRPENIVNFTPLTWLDNPRPNVWYGTSVEDQQRADERIPHLLKVPAAVRFLSCEPLLGPVTLRSTPEGQLATTVRTWLEYNQRVGDGKFNPATYSRIDWVIVGGESGPGARPMHPNWARQLRDQCVAAGLAFFFKQWGEYRPLCEDESLSQTSCMVDIHGNDGTGGANEDVFSFLQRRPVRMRRVGKKAAGRLLDGREWNEIPESVEELA